ncbi:MAG: hypothetical protein AAGA68_15360 [Pseudomonadota bacterium]
MWTQQRLPSLALVLIVATYMSACDQEIAATTFQGQPLRGGTPDAVVLTIDDQRLPSVLVSRSKGSVNLGVFQANTHAPMLTLRDQDNDGVMDLLTYSALSADGKVLVAVEDYGMDGQPDFIFNRQARSAQVFYRGHWRKVDGVGTGSTTVDVEGDRLPLTRVMGEIGRPTQ